MDSAKVKISKNDYYTMGAGAAIGAVGAKKIINNRITGFAKDTFEALAKGGEKLTSLTSKNGQKLQKIAASKKGFFGKINKIITGSAEGATVSEKVETASKIIEGYKAKAAKLLGQNAADKEIKALANRLQKQDIAKSIKSSCFLQNAAKVAGAAIIGAIVFSSAKEVVSKIKADKLLNKTNEEVETSKAKPSEDKSDETKDEPSKTAEREDKVNEAEASETVETEDKPVKKDSSTED